MKPKRNIVLITGCNGRIGSAVMRRLTGHFSEALLHGCVKGRSCPYPSMPYEAICERRTEWGRPALIMRFKTATAAAASARWPAGLRARNLGPMIPL